MKIAVISDIHLEFYRDNNVIPSMDLPKELDLLICAGDLDQANRGIEWLASFDVPTLYIAGNHEFYHSEYHACLDTLRAEASEYDHLTFLENKFIDIGEHRFLGATLWTDFNFNGTPAESAEICTSRINDFREISFEKEKEKSRLFTPEDSIELFNRSINFFSTSLSQTKRNIIISHHLPFQGSVPPQFIGSALAPAFVSHCDRLLDHQSVDLWIHGHSHTPVDYQIGQTKVVSHPIGYFNQEHQQKIITPLTMVV